MKLLVDVHAHLDDARFKGELDSVIDRARKAGVVSVITNGIDPETNRKTLEIAKRYDIVKPALGWYPWDAFPNPGRHDTEKLNN